jgi:murein DD-endopeptidase MepM/ murein hydrolase activator NlpD
MGQFRHGTPVFKDAAGNLSVPTASQPVTLTHPGVDLVAPCGVSPIYPVSDGTVEKVINSPSDPSWGVPGKKGLGYAVLVHHSQNTAGKQTYSLYLHMNKPPEVTPGQMVSGGKTRLGFVGETGAAWGCHTHFEIRHFSSFVLSDARWSSPSNIYGTGDKRGSPVFLDNWENPELLLGNNAAPLRSSTRRSLVAVQPGSNDAKAILQAQIAWMKTDPQLSTVNLSPIVVKRNDKYAYLVARISVSGSRPSWLAKDPFLDAILEWKDGHWTSFGYQGGSPKHGGSIADMCGYGAGVKGDVFRECDTTQQPHRE